MLKKDDFFPQAAPAASRFLLPAKGLRMLPPGNMPVAKSNTFAQGVASRNARRSASLESPDARCSCVASEV